MWTLTKSTQWSWPCFGITSSAEQRSETAEMLNTPHIITMSKPPIDMRETWVLRVNTVRIRMSIEHFDKVSAAYDKMRPLKND